MSTLLGRSNHYRLIDKARRTDKGVPSGMSDFIVQQDSFASYGHPGCGVFTEACLNRMKEQF